MAALTTTQQTLRLPIGDRVMQTFRATLNASPDQTTEWIATGFTLIDAVFGAVVIGTVPPAGGVVTAGVAATSAITWIATDPSDNDTVTVDGQVYTLKTALTARTAAVRATATVTFDATNPTTGDTIVVNGRSYSIDDTPSGVDSIDLTNTETALAVTFANAINASAADGATTQTVDTDINVDVQATVSGAVVTLHALVPGVGAAGPPAWGNSLTLTESGTGVTLSGATFTGGADEIDTVPYEVLISNTEATMATNFAGAINGTLTPGTEYSLGTAPHPAVSAVAASAVVTLTARVPGTVGNAITLAEASTGITSVTSPFTGGLDAVVDAAGLNFVKNAQGTGVAAGTNNGDLGVEGSSASLVIEVTVIGIP